MHRYSRQRLPLRILLIHHTEGHFEVALSFAAQLRERYHIALWSNSLEIRDRYTVLAMCGIANFDPNAEYDVSVLLTPEYPWNGIAPEVMNIMMTKPMLATTHDYLGLIPFDHLYPFGGAPMAAVTASLGFDLSHLRKPPGTQRIRLIVQGNLWPVRGYNQISEILNQCPDVSVDIVGASRGQVPADVVAQGVLSHSRVRILTNLAEIPFYQTIASGHFLLPLIDPKNFPRYFEAALSSSITVGFSQSLPFIAHRKLFDLYPIEGFAYESEAELIDAVRGASEIGSGPYSALVERQLAARQELVARFQLSFDLALGRISLPTAGYPLAPFKYLVRRCNMIWNEDRDTISIPANFIGRILRPLLGWFPDNQGPSGSVEVSRKQLAALLRPVLAKIEVDKEWYRGRYLGKDESGIDPRAHFMTVGYFRDYLPRPVHVDETFYLPATRDASDTNIGGFHRSAQCQYEDSGLAELRRPHPGWLRSEVFVAATSPPDDRTTAALNAALSEAFTPTK